MNDGGSAILTDLNADGVRLISRYGALPEHIFYYIVEADSIDAVNTFLLPGFKRCTSKVTPVTQDKLKK